MGRREFESVVAQASRETFRNIAEISDEELAAGAVENIDFYSSPGTVSQMVSFYFSADPPDDAASGYHGLEIMHPNGGSYTSGGSTYNALLRYHLSSWYRADLDDAVYPKGGDAQGAAIRAIRFDSLIPVRLNYQNNTDVPQTHGRSYACTVVERQIVK